MSTGATIIHTPIVTALPAAACLSLVWAAFVSYRGSSARALRTTRLASLLALAFAASSLAIFLRHGAVTSPLLGFAGVGLSFRIDALSTLLFTLVAFVGYLVCEYSRNYLAGSKRQAEFFGHLSLTVAAAILMSTSANLVQLVIGWIAMSLALHRLLVFFGERPRAVAAARKKFYVARAGDASLAAAAILLWTLFGTTDIVTILDEIRTAASDSAPPAALSIAAVLIALAAILKSAQFPTHGWILDVMETPTPVSALLHAGIVNAGGFLVFRFADLMIASHVAMITLVLVGGFTALFGSLAMTAQSNIKVSLAYSTVAQMGFMLLQCGFGAFSSAGLHLVAHSLYKAHSFLASGTAVDQVKTIRAVADDQGPPLSMLILSLAIALAIFAGIGTLFNHEITESLAVQTLGAIFIMGLFVFIAKGAGSTAILARVVPAAAVAALLYFSLQTGSAIYFGGQVPDLPTADVLDWAVAAVVIVSFAALTLMQLVRLPNQSPWVRSAYIHFANGLYANAIFNRLTGALSRETPIRR